MRDGADNLTKKPGENVVKGRLVSITADDTVVYPLTAGALEIIGVVQEDMFDWTNEQASVKKDSFVEVEVAAPVVAGEELEVTADGRVQPEAGGGVIAVAIESQPDVGYRVLVEVSSLSGSGGVDPTTFPAPTAGNPVDSLYGFDAAGEPLLVPIEQVGSQLVNSGAGVVDVAGLEALDFDANKAAYRVLVDTTAGDVAFDTLSTSFDPDLTDTNELTLVAETGANNVTFTYGGVTVSGKVITLRLHIDPANAANNEWYPLNA